MLVYVALLCFYVECLLLDLGLLVSCWLSCLVARFCICVVCLLCLGLIDFGYVYLGCWFVG